MAGVVTRIRDNPPVDEAERLLHLFVHDLRAPLGVATGYLRLIQDGRLAGDGDQKLALTRTLDALGRIASLCDAMSDFGGVPPEQIGRLAPEDLISRVVAQLKTSHDVESDPRWEPGSVVVVGRDGDRFAKAIALVIGTVARRSSPTAVTYARRNGACLQFALGQHSEPDLTTGAPFDPWRGFGLEVVLACQAIEATGGRVRSGGDADVAIELPLVRQEVL